MAKAHPDDLCERVARPMGEGRLARHTAQMFRVTVASVAG